MKALFAVSTVGFALGCGGDPIETEESDPAMAIASGNGQTAVAGAQLANPVAVRVTRDGSNVSGTSVTWTVTSGGGSVSPTSSVTDNTGQASTTWTLGANPGLNALQASASGVTGSPVTFGATGTDPTPPMQAAVSVQDFAFNPASRTVAAGGTVTWTWAGSATHNVTFPAGSSSVDQTQGTFMRTFPTAGSFGYQCTIHPSTMQGTIVVQ